MPKDSIEQALGFRIIFIEGTKIPGSGFRVPGSGFRNLEFGIRNSYL
jgi:hypothetical protein